jgi:hypothetical protein
MAITVIRPIGRQLFPIESDVSEVAEYQHEQPQEQDGIQDNQKRRVKIQDMARGHGRPRPGKRPPRQSDKSVDHNKEKQEDQSRDSQLCDKRILAMLTYEITPHAADGDAMLAQGATDTHHFSLLDLMKM